MNLTKLVAGISLVGAALGGMATVQAQTMQAIQGDDVVFYYDADLWGSNSATVTGNSISFSMPASFHLSATGLNDTDSPFSYYIGHSASALVVVAKNGYVMGSNVSVALQGSANLVAGGNTMAFLGQNLSSGFYQSNSYMPNHQLEFVSFAGYTDQTGYSETYTSATGAVNYTTLGFAGDLGVQVSHTGVGVSTASLNEVSYAFKVSAVPEPDTYLLMLAGAGVLAYARRRTRRALACAGQ